MTLNEYLAARHTKGTAKRYMEAIRDYHKAVSEQKAQTATYTEIMAYIGKLRERYNSPKTVKSCLHGIKKYYSWLIHTGQRKDHPCKYLRLRDKESRDIQLQDLFSEQELGLLMERKERYPRLEIKNRAMISLLIYQALTGGEIAKLTIHDLNLEEGTVRVKPSVKLNGRTLKLQNNQVMLFYKYIFESRPKLLKEETTKLFIGMRGTAENHEGVNYLVKTYKKLFPEKNLNPKTIRQSVIANKLKLGHDLRVVQHFAGHKYPSSTERYKQTQVEELKHQVLRHHPLQIKRKEE